jgi:hypothetical protein
LKLEDLELVKVRRSWGFARGAEMTDYAMAELIKAVRRGRARWRCMRIMAASYGGERRM